MKKKSFEENLEEAKALVEKLMDNSITLEESIKLYKDGLKAIEDAQKALESAKLKIKKISKDEFGDEL
jgi:exodeoxyribonuclease VII small subunit